MNNYLKKNGKITMRKNNVNSWDSQFFIVAGCFMLINTLFLWLRHFSNYQMSILWPAIPAITGLAFSVFGLLKLYPRVTNHSPLVAKSGAGLSLLALASLSLVALWIFVVSVFGEGMQEQQSQWLLVLIVLFMVAMILAFFTNAIVFLSVRTHQKIGYLLTMPLAMWFIMLVVGVIKGIEKGLSLDFYTNPVIGAAFLALGFTLKANRNLEG
ncbi:MAG: hypothetical protein ACI9YH_002347 [Colwellia sp.]|jgi:hypothetical protein